MSLKNRIAMTSLMLVVVFLMSAVITVPALADDGQPPVTPITTEEPIDSTEGDSATDASLPDPQPAPETAAEPAPVAESEQLLADIPDNTEVVVLNENGETVPLVTEEASEIIVVGDPIWCPATVTVPTPGLGGCTISYPSLSGLLGDPIFSSTGPGVNGVIWIEKTYDKANDNAAITLDGNTLTSMSAFTLTLKGGWNGAGTGTQDLLTPSIFDVSLHIINWKNDVTLSNIVFDATTTGSANTLEVSSTKNIKLDRVKVTNNPGGNGARLDNSASVTSGTGVTVTNSEFSNNGDRGLYVLSSYNITLTSVIANGNGGSTYSGAILDNTASTTAGTVTVTTGTFNGNGVNGLHIISEGKVTLSNITANGNANGIGMFVDNATTAALVDVVLSGTNTFSNNWSQGLNISSKGAVTLNDVLAHHNGETGALVKNDYLGSIGAVTLTGSAIFTENAVDGLQILTNGLIKINNMTASSNSQIGANLDNRGSSTAQPVTLTGTNRFEDNGSDGLYIQSDGLITINNINANINGARGISLNNTSGTTTGVTLTGINIFNENNGDGLYIRSNGLLTLANLTANGSVTGYGANLENSSAPAAAPTNVTLTGTNVFNNNAQDGIFILTRGVITVNALTANYNGGNGTNLANNVNSALIRGVTVNGINTFIGNGNHGLYVVSFGAISLANITANLNGAGGVYGDGANISNETGITVATVTLAGTNKFNQNRDSGLVVNSLGTITVSYITANDNVNGYGASLVNTLPSVAAPVTVGGINSFIHNKVDGLRIWSKGLITITSVTASESVSGYGVHLDNTFSTTQMGVTLNGTNVFASNYDTGLYVKSYGIITISNVNASSNGHAAIGYGAYLYNVGGAVVKGVTILGVNTFNGNRNGGLLVNTNGLISAASVTASNNVNGSGASFDNNLGAFTNGVTLTGVNAFSGNGVDGLKINSFGVITLSNITASNNGLGGSGGNGLAVFNNAVGSIGPVTLTGVNVFNDNRDTGLKIYSRGVISITGVTANNNGLSSANGYGADLNNTSNVTTVVKSISFGGFNTFNGNYSGGLLVNTKGAVTSLATGSLTANSNTNGKGIWILNNSVDPAKPQSVSLSGKIFASNNYQEGLRVESQGSITVSNVTATGNNTSALVNPGVYLFNLNSIPVIPAGITVSGTNLVTGNLSTGLIINSYGLITVSNLNASNNGAGGTGSGAVLNTNNLPSTKIYGVTLTGINVFSGNADDGLFIDVPGAVTMSSIVASGNLNGNGLSIFNKSLGAALPQNVTISGVNVFSNNDQDGLYINTYGTILLASITANSNGKYGLEIAPQGLEVVTPRNVTITGTNTFNGNQTGGLFIRTHGSIVLSNVTASGNGNGVNTGTGAYLHNANSYTVAAVVKQSTGVVTLTGINVFSNNFVSGLDINSYGAIALNALTANGNGHNPGIGYGVQATNAASAALVAPKITITGVNTFNNNFQTGLNLTSRNLISVNSVTANGNGDYGAYLENSIAVLTGITMTGVNSFESNGDTGLVVFTSGAVNLTKVAADDNGNNGVYIESSGVVNLTCGSFTNNTGYGLHVFHSSTLTLKGVIAAGNTGGNLNTSGAAAVVTVRTCPLP